METNHKLFKTGKALLFITSGLLLSGACLQARPWTTEEDQILTDAVKSGNRCWVVIAERIQGKTANQCQQRWTRVLDPAISHEDWTPEEDQKLRDIMAQIKNDENSEYRHSSGKYKGQLNWVAIAKGIPGKTNDQCQQRWMRVLDPNINHEEWTPAEDALLTRLVETHGEGHWVTIARLMGNRTDKQCYHRWTRVLDPNISHEDWTPEEDQKLRDIMAQIKNDENSEYRHSSGKYKGQLNWVAIAKGIPGRTDQQCRDHWTNTLDPTISHEDWTEDKDDQLRHLVQTFAKKNGKPNWPAIAGQIDGKTPKQCRDHYYNTLNPEIHKSPWTAEEDAVLTELVQRHGEGNWAAIAEQIPGRTAKQVQNRWKSLNRFQQQQQQQPQAPAPENLPLSVHIIPSQHQAPAPADWPQTPADYYRLSADQAPADRPLPLLNIRQAPADQNPAVRYFQQAENQAPALVQPLQPVTIFPTKITDFLN